MNKAEQINLAVENINDLIKEIDELYSDTCQNKSRNGNLTNYNFLLKRMLIKSLKIVEELTHHNSSLKEKLDIAVEALEFYANPNSNMTLYGEVLPTSIRQAREALIKIKGEK